MLNITWFSLIGSPSFKSYDATISIIKLSSANKLYIWNSALYSSIATDLLNSPSTYKLATNVSSKINPSGSTNSSLNVILFSSIIKLVIVGSGISLAKVLNVNEANTAPVIVEWPSNKS